jgi:hypothetical protein
LEVRRVLSSNPSRYKLTDFLLKFEKDAPTTPEAESEDSSLLRSLASKTFWMSLVGMKQPQKEQPHGVADRT